MSETRNHPKVGNAVQAFNIYKSHIDKVVDAVIDQLRTRLLEHNKDEPVEITYPVVDWMSSHIESAVLKRLGCRSSDVVIETARDTLIVRLTNETMTAIHAVADDLDEAIVRIVERGDDRGTVPFISDRTWQLEFIWALYTAKHYWPESSLVISVSDDRSSLNIRIDVDKILALEDEDDGTLSEAEPLIVSAEMTFDKENGVYNTVDDEFVVESPKLRPTLPDATAVTYNSSTYVDSAIHVDKWNTRPRSPSVMFDWQPHYV